MFAAAAGASLIAGTISGIATDAAAAHNNNPKLQAQTQTNAKLQMLDSLNEKLIESGAPSGIPYLDSFVQVLAFNLAIIIILHLTVVSDNQANFLAFL